MVGMVAVCGIIVLAEVTCVVLVVSVDKSVTCKGAGWFPGGLWFTVSDFLEDCDTVACCGFSRGFVACLTLHICRSCAGIWIL